MAKRSIRWIAAALVAAACTNAQSQTPSANQNPSPAPAAGQAQGRTTNDPFPQPIPPTEGAIGVSFVEFAALPDVGSPARMMLLTGEPGGRRLFVNDMRGSLYGISDDGKAVTLFLDLNDPKWGVSVQSQNNERGFQSFAFHP